MLALFVLACWQMQADWTHDETYHYGWAVPVLTAYLLSVRWRDRPRPGRGVSASGLTTHPPEHQIPDPYDLQTTVKGAGPMLETPPSPRPSAKRTEVRPEALTPLCLPKYTSSIVRLAGYAAAGLMLLFAWLVQEANPGWRPVAIGMTVSALVAAWCWLGDAGGRGWQWHFAGAVSFFAVAVPWPQVLENAVTGVLMPLNAAMTLEVLHWLGIPAVRSGNLITLSQGTLGVEEACSGIRSLQATLMMALFLGELHALPVMRRSGILVVGATVALFTNATRTVILSTIGARSGLDAAADWHDGLGWAVLVVHAATLALCGSSWARPASADAVAPPSFAFHPPSSDPESSSSILDPPSPTLLPLRGPLILLFLIAISPPLTQIWYDRSKPEIPPPAWTLVPPTGAQDFTPIPIHAVLQQDKGWSAKWHLDRDHRFHAFYCEWRADGPARPGNVAAHRPEVCLRGIGMVPEGESPGGIPIRMAGRLMPVRCLKFDDHGQALFVAILEENSEGFGPASPGVVQTCRRRLGAVWRGRRNEPRRLLEVGLWGAASESEAKTILREFLQNHMSVDPAAAPSRCP